MMCFSFEFMRARLIFRLRAGAELFKVLAVLEVQRERLSIVKGFCV
jgi:hypothetical protein